MLDAIEARETIEHNGDKFTVQIFPDYNHGAPWEEEDGHGPVSDWTTRNKTPGELILVQDGPHKKFYDFQEACKIARRDGWDSSPLNTGQETKRQQAAKAARANFEHLRRYAEGQWNYVGVIVEKICPCCNTPSGETQSLWGIESFADDYLDEVAQELVEEF